MELVIYINCMPAWEGRRLELRECPVQPLPDCSVRPFAEANCPHRTPLICVFFDCGNTTEKISLLQIGAPFSSLGGFLYELFKKIMDLECLAREYCAFSSAFSHKFLPLSYQFYSWWLSRCGTYSQIHCHRKRYAFPKEVQLSSQAGSSFAPLHIIKKRLQKSETIPRKSRSYLLLLRGI